MIEVKIKKGESVDKALRKLKKKLDKENVLGEVRSRRYYEKPTRKKYFKQRKAKYNQRNKSIREARNWS
jgi:small subunit ribosomal protein S21|tara:strand:- start:153 stop:359 length:207 start_codon:yes stop_codon:yes gene_type:complete